MWQLMIFDHLMLRHICSWQQPLSLVQRRYWASSPPGKVIYHGKVATGQKLPISSTHPYCPWEDSRYKLVDSLVLLRQNKLILHNSYFTRFFSWSWVRSLQIGAPTCCRLRDCRGDQMSLYIGYILEATFCAPYIVR